MTAKAAVRGIQLRRITIFHTAEHHYDLCVAKQGGGTQLWLRKRVADILAESPRVLLENTDKAVLRIDAEKTLYTFRAGTDRDHLVTIGTGRTQLLSTEGMTGTFTGCFAGLFAEGDAEAAFRYFAAEEK